MSNNKEARQYSVLAVMDGFSKTVRWKVSTLLVDGKSNNVFSLRKFAVKQSGGRARHGPGLLCQQPWRSSSSAAACERSSQSFGRQGSVERGLLRYNGSLGIPRPTYANKVLAVK